MDDSSFSNDPVYLTIKPDTVEYVLSALEAGRRLDCTGTYKPKPAKPIDHTRAAATIGWNVQGALSSYAVHYAPDEGQVIYQVTKNQQFIPEVAQDLAHTLGLDNTRSDYQTSLEHIARDTHEWVLAGGSELQAIGLGIDAANEVVIYCIPVEPELPNVSDVIKHDWGKINY